MNNSLIKTFFKYTGLNILGMIGLSCYILADTFFVAKALGTIGLAALNFAISVYSVMYGIGLMIGIGGATDFSIKKGKNNNSNNAFMHSLLIAGIFAFIFILAGIFLPDQISKLLGADSSTIPLTSLYIRVIMLFSPFFLLNNILIAFIRNDDNPNLSMTAMLISSFSNIVLDYIFVFPLNMGMLGAVLATCISPIISIGILSIHFIKKKNSFHFKKFTFILSELKVVISLGFSSFIGELASSISLIVFNIVLMNLKGNVGVAAYGIIANIALVVIAIFNGLAQGAQPLASRYYGTGDFKKLNHILRYAIGTSLVLSVIIYVVLCIFTEPIVAMFSGNDKFLEALASTGARIYFIGIIFASINVFLASFLSATSKYIQALAISILRSSVILVPAVIIFSFILNINGVWLAYVVTEFLVFTLSVIFTINLIYCFKKNY